MSNCPTTGVPTNFCTCVLCQKPADELDRAVESHSALVARAAELEAEAAESDAQRERLAKLLTGTADAFHDGPLENGLWSWHDLPELARDHRAMVKRLVRGYVSLLETGRDRIIATGGTCDPVDVMEANDPLLREARALINEPARRRAEVAALVKETGASS